MSARTSATAPAAEPARSARLERLGLAFNPTSAGSLALRDRTLEWCSGHGVAAWAAAAAERETLDDQLPGSQVLLVLGGDGTFLRAFQAVAAADADVPILGINVGRVGFLSQVDPEALEQTLARLHEGTYVLEQRLVVQARVRREGSAPGAPLVALNEAAVVRGGQPRVVRLDVAIGGSHLATYIADGLLVATPTGSTAYSFSAGGPILDPSSRNLVVTSVAAYLAAIRSVVVGPRQTVTIRVLEGRDVLLSIDGHVDVPLSIGDVVEVAARDRPVGFVVPDGALRFWDLLRHKAELLPT
jgi:NAD+ kinase